MGRGKFWLGLMVGIATSTQACGDAAPMAGPDLALGNAGNDAGNAGNGSTNGNDAGSTSSALSNMPCDVSSLLSTYCITCHQDPPLAGSRVSLLSVDDLKAPGPGGNGTMADEALRRMQATDGDRMPPAGNGPSASAIDAFSGWVAQGLPAGACATADAGAGDPAFSGASVCTSGSTWSGGDDGSSRMNPGQACISCHEREDDAPHFALAGTVFPTGHEPNNCLGANGTSGSIRVEVTDADGNVTAMDVNRSGNFYSRSSVRFPITARVIADGKERVMAVPVDSGDCNSCHTESGTESAPGRIALP